MKHANGIIAGTLTAVLLLISSSSFADEYFCISSQGKPKHCNKGDIVLVKPTMVPRVCDFDAEILRMPKSETQAEYLCRYTGTILAVKELISRKPPPASQNNNTRPPPQQRQQKKNKMFDNMPFFN